MNKDQAWKNNSNGELLQFAYQPPGQWSAERMAEEHAAVAALLDEPDAGAGADQPGWLRLAARLPRQLRQLVALELRHGNEIVGIGSNGWPNHDSVVVNLRARFSAAHRTPTPGVVWRDMNDPRYCREELSQQVDGTEFLAIT